MAAVMLVEEGDVASLEAHIMQVGLKTVLL